MRALSNEGSEHVIVRCGLLKKNDKFTQESFSHHWLHIHGPIAAGMKNLRVCNQNLVIDNEHRHPIMGGVIDIDGYSELHFDTYSEMLEGVQSLDAETGNALLDDARSFCRSACATSWCFPATWCARFLRICGERTWFIACRS